MINNMRSSSRDKKRYPGLRKKILVSLLFFVITLSALMAPIKPANAAGLPVVDIPKFVWDKVEKAAKYLWQKGASLAFQQTLRSALNKMAYDTANWIGSGGEGQKPLFITQGWGDYMLSLIHI